MARQWKDNAHDDGTQTERLPNSFNPSTLHQRPACTQHQPGSARSRGLVVFEADSTCQTINSGTWVPIRYPRVLSLCRCGQRVNKKGLLEYGPALEIIDTADSFVRVLHHL
jgi:hypothetical protein